MKIIFVGAQGTGKSTILNYYKERGYNCITEVVRNLSKEGVKINEKGNIKGQKIIFNTYKDLFSKNDNYISDRGLIDVCAYTGYLHCRKQSVQTEKLFTNQYMDILEFNENNSDVKYFYFPIEFQVVDDGVRSVDEDYRREIDGYIKLILDKTNVDYITVSGSIEDRIKIVNDYISSQN